MKKLFFGIIIIIFGISFFNHNAIKMKMRKTKITNNILGDFDKEWKKVDSLINNGLPKSALEIIEEIYKKSKEKENHDQMLKAYIYKLKLKVNLEENSFEKLLYELREDVKTAKFPTNAMMHSMLAEMYTMYYNENSYTFMSRTATVKFDNDDIQTWSLDQLINEIIKHYNLSLENATELQKINLEKYYKEIIEWGNVKKEIRPTLYDFLANRAISYFLRGEIALTRPADIFQLKDDIFFGSTEEFINIKITTNDTLSMHYNCFLIIQNLLKFRYQNISELEAFIDVELARLEFVKNYSVNNQKDELYLKALLNMETKYKDKEAVAEVSYNIANYYYTKSSAYKSDDETTQIYKDYRKKSYDICENIIKKYSTTLAADKAKYTLGLIKSISLSFMTERTISVKEKFAGIINYCNVTKFYYKVAKIERTEYQSITKKLWGTDAYKKIMETAKTVYSDSISLKTENDFNSHSSEILLNGLDEGFYVVVVANNSNFSYEKNITTLTALNVSNLSYIKQKEKDGSQNLYVLNRKTGEPIKNANVRCFYQKWNSVKREYVETTYETYATDETGFVKIKSTPAENSVYLYIEITNNKDVLYTDDMFWLSFSEDVTRKDRVIHFFTDRAIYRPGQTVFFKGISLFKDNKNNVEIIKNEATRVTFYDPNWQVQNTLDLTTNDFGSFSGSFVIPTTSLNGKYQIYTSNGSVVINVEEYKRPTFEITMLPFDGNYLLNDSITVKGKAANYSGAMLTDAQVKYRVQRQPKWRGWWYRYVPYTTTEIQNGEITTDDKGEFTITFKAIPDLTYPETEFMAFNYTISVDVTDLNGETQSYNSSIIVGYRSLNLSINLYGNISKDNEKADNYIYEINTSNLNAQKITASGDIKIYKLKDNLKPLRERMWTKPETYFYTKIQWEELFAGNVYNKENDFQELEIEKQVFDDKFNTANKTTIDIKEIKNWESGIYRVKMSALDAFGKTNTYETNFVVYSEKDKTLAYNTINLFSAIKTYCEPGENAKFLIGTALENVKILYQIEYNNKITKSQWLTLNKEQMLIEIPVTEEHRGNFTVHFVFIKDNRIYNNSSIVTVPRTDKKMNIEFSSFRDKLLPGQTEKWSLTIKGANGDKVMSELLISMYDQSLDKFAANTWNFNIYNSYYNQMPWSTATFSTASSSQYYYSLNDHSSYPSIIYNTLNWYDFSYNNYRYRYAYDDYDGVMVESLSEDDADESPYERKDKLMSKKSESPAAPVMMDAVNEEEKETNIPVAETENFDDVKVRTDFSETAFFYPQLQTNENGEVVVSFTVPESLTRWKIMGFTHTQDLKYGFVENYLVTQKDLMLIPNAPRFFREGDKMEFPVKISNISDKDLKGQIKLEFFDAVTLQSIDNVIVKSSNKTQDFKVNANGNTLITWELEIPDSKGLISYKVVAKAGETSDGEQKPIPVLTNRMLVTESLPLWIRGNSKKEFTLEKLKNNESKTLKNHKLTLEFPSNPAWYAVQSLPYLMEYPYECNEQTFSRFYANSLATHIANSNPNIQTVFEAWKDLPSSEALLSNLEKNQELKSIILQETPWVLQAQDETKRKKQVGLLFDLNRMSGELAIALNKLKKEQSANGGWPWFAGMPESQYITQHIVSGMGHLDKLGVTDIQEDHTTRKMITDAIGYMDYEIVEDYKWLKKYYTDEELKQNHLSSIAIHYFYARSFFNDAYRENNTQEAYDYYFSQMKEYWLSQSLYNQGLIALALYRYGEKTIATNIVKSIKENSITSEELGMYWISNVAGYSWNEAPIETQALMIEVFTEITEDNEAIDNAKIWLLKNKQTNDWTTTKATCEAVYALLLQGTEWLDDNQLCDIKLGKTTIDPYSIEGTAVEAGTGYFKTSWSKDEIKPEMAKVNIENKNDVIAWGALYWQYFEDLDKITPAATPLNLKKQLFKEIITDKGAVIEPITDKSELKIGDKIIVRIELRVDRDMDYVHMKDMRASGLEPINVISKYKYQDGLGYYESTKDAATNFFFSSLTKGTYVFEYPLRVTHNGDFSNGITTIQCMYAPEFTSHSEGVRVNVK